MKSARDILSSLRSPGLFVTLALLSTALFAAEPTKPVEESTGQASSKIDNYRADSSDVNKAEAKAALERLDADLDLLEAKIDSITVQARKQEFTNRLKVLKERRKELNREFRKARYDALASDVKTEWSELTN